MLDLLRGEQIAQAVAQQVEAQHDDDDGQRRKDRNPPLVRQVAGAVGHHRAQARLGRLHAQARRS